VERCADARHLKEWSYQFFFIGRLVSATCGVQEQVQVSPYPCLTALAIAFRQRRLEFLLAQQAGVPARDLTWSVKM
jgi:hypothetical protein